MDTSSISDEADVPSGALAREKNPREAWYATIVGRTSGYQQTFHRSASVKEHTAKAVCDTWEDLVPISD